MTDKEKLDAIRAEILRLVHVCGYDREMANDLLTFMNSLPNEPVSDFEMALTEMIDNAQKCVIEPWAVAAQWKDYLIELAKSEEPVSGEWIEELRTKLDSMSKEEFEQVWEKYRVEEEEPVSENLEEAAKHYLYSNILYDDVYVGNPTDKDCIEMFKAGAKWQKEQFEKDYTNLCNGIATVKGLAVTMAYDNGVADTKERMMKNIWKPADGDDLPDIDREVIALLNNGKVVFAHRPYKGKYIGKNLTTGNIETFENKTYDKGDWNQPDVKYWLDVELPK